MIDFNNASRWYGQVIGLNDITATIPAGITALLGQNGAGKSTMMRLITGQLRPTTGSITVLGQEPFANPEVYKQLGYCPDIDHFYEHMSGRQFVHHLARLQGLAESQARSRTDDVLYLVGMAERADRRIQGYSKGMRQRIKLAQAMLHDPKILLLDEPLNGLDPLGRVDFMRLLDHLSQQGKAIIVSSHILFEVEQMTRNIMLLHRGRLLANGDLTDIRNLIDRYPHRVKIQSTQVRDLASRLGRLPYVTSLEFDRDPKILHIQTHQLNDFFDQLATIALEHEIPITEFQSPDNNLESIYEYLVEARS